MTKKATSDRPIEDLQAGEAFRQSVIGKADSMRHDAPLWYGWVIMEAFLAGIDYARNSGSKGERP